LTEPKAALTTQYVELLKTEGVELEFADDAIDRLAEIAAQVNERQENIGARRLHTVLERLLDTLSYEAPDKTGKVTIDRAYVEEHLGELVEDPDLRRYILCPWANRRESKSPPDGGLFCAVCPVQGVVVTSKGTASV